jgi:hypothetical protein
MYAVGYNYCFEMMKSYKERKEVNTASNEYFDRRQSGTDNKLQPFPGTQRNNTQS